MDKLNGLSEIAIDAGIVWLAAIASVAGAFGGCSAAGLMILGSKSAIRMVQFLAYVFIGMTSGLLTFLFGDLGGIETTDTMAVIRWSVAMGISVPVTLFSKNIAIMAVLRRFGIEVKFTIRKQTEDRRKTDDSDK